jgi:NADH-quinone oxidoreductase subunit C
MMTTPSTTPNVPVHPQTLESLTKALGAENVTSQTFRDNLRVYVSASRLIEALRTLKEQCGFALLAELGATDYLGYPGPTRTRYEVHYVMRNLDTNERIIVKAGADDPEPTLPSSTCLWGGANWMEREVFDMYGIAFAGHPDLRRILMPPEFTAFPLRKDYPLRGRGERHNFPRLTRGES